jgi:hypothetical protein
MWRGLGVVASVAALFALRALSLLPYGDAPEHAVLRLTWSARPERVEQCRQLSDAELAQRPAHMRLRTECEGRFAAYALSVFIDAQAVLADTVRGGGLRHDRPIHVLRDLSVPPGVHTMRIALARIDSTTASSDTSAISTGVLGDRAQREADERRRRAAEAIPSALSLDTTLTFSAGQAIMVSYLNEQRRLALITSVTP